MDLISGYSTFNQGINLGISIMACLISILSYFMIRISRKIDMSGAVYLLHIVAFNLAYGVSYLLEIMIRMTHWRGSAVKVIYAMAIYGQFILPFVIVFSLIAYLFYRVEKKGRILEWKKKFMVLLFIYLIPTVVNFFCPILYYVDSNMEYHRGSWYVPFTFFNILLAVFVIYFLIHYHEKLDRELIASSIIYIVLLVGSIIYLIFFPAINILVYTMTLGIFIMILYIQSGQGARYQKSEQELQDLQVRLILSQMRPHFLYNALSSISQLCKSDGQQASEMTDSFYVFLSKNMNDIIHSEPVLFQQELEYIRNYIAIEKMRFGEDLEVIYHIEDEDFYVPPLVIQPLLENAIKHGLGGKEEGGILSISSRIFKKGHIITIADDGEGFDPEQVDDFKDGRVHVGMNFVKKRLSEIPGSVLMIKSQIGKGTTVILVIPDSYTIKCREEHKKE